MRIENENGRVIDGVDKGGVTHGWQKEIDDIVVLYLPEKGWREVPECVDVTGEFEPYGTRLIWKEQHTAYFPEMTNLEWRKVQAVVLPEDWRERFCEATDTNNSVYVDYVERWLDSLKTPVLQIWKGGE